MSINFNDDMGPKAKAMIEKLFDVQAIDNTKALLGKTDTIFLRSQMSDIARAAKQPATLEIHKIGDRKEVGGVVYELQVMGWKKLPIGTSLHGE